jgi:hypothetical protein
VNESFPALNIVAKSALIRSLLWDFMELEGDVNAGIIRKVAEGGWEGVATFPQ